MKSISFTGCLGKDVETKQVNGVTVHSLNIATNDHIKGADVTTWIQVSAWGNGYDKVSKYWLKGTCLQIAGKLTPIQAYIDNHGIPRASLSVRAYEVSFVAGTGKKDSDDKQSAVQGKIESINPHQHEQTTSNPQQSGNPDDDYLPF